MTLERVIDTTLNGTGDSDAHLMTIFGITTGIRAKTILELGVREVPQLSPSHGCKVDGWTRCQC